MYKKTDKKRLYWIIELYLSGKINGESFCDDFHDSFGLEIDSDFLSTSEEKAFDDLNEIVGRYSSSEQDHEKYPGLYYTEKELFEKVKETQEHLGKTLKELVVEELKDPDDTVTKSASILDNTWLMCPDCIDAWEESSKNAMVICPKCNQVFHNPRFQNEKEDR